MHRWLLVGVLLALLVAPVAAQSVLKVSSAQTQALGIKVGTVPAATQVPLEGLPATVLAPLQNSTVVSAPFGGLTMAILAREGEAVRRGQPLARIQSREAMTLGADLAAARGDFRVAEAQATRDRQLLEEGIIPAARVQTALAQRDSAAAHLRELEAATAMAPQAAGAAPGTYELRAPLDGVVIERDLRLGEPVAALSKAFIVAKPGVATLEMQIPARYAAQLRTGLQVRTDDGATGTVDEVGAAVHTASQTVLVRASLRGEHLLPGQQTSATLLLPAPTQAWLLPAGALTEHAGARVLFVAQGEGFVPVTVTLLAQTSDGQSVVVAPLTATSRVALAGAGALKAMLAAGG